MSHDVGMIDIMKIGEAYGIALGNQSSLEVGSSENDLVGDSKQGQQIED